MGIQLGSNFTVQTGLPLDDRLVCETLDQRDAIPRDVRYEWRRVSLGAHWVDSRESSLLRRLERGREIGL